LGCNTRHFYNNSPVPFTVSLDNAGKCSIGSSGQQYACVVPPMEVADLHYASNYGDVYSGLGMPTPTVTIQSNDEGRIYSPQRFGVYGCYIQHSGNTGNIVVNDPADGDVVTCGVGDYRCDCLAGGTCAIDRSNWTPKPLDMTRTERGCGGSTDISCWKRDDDSRDHLDMRASMLNFVSEIVPNGSFPDQGRFIFVYRVSDNKLVIRRYDRAHNEDDATLGACLDYARYRYPANQRGDIYQHVRHSQLNGGWGPVYCAGEMTIKNGALWRLNNASGHYKPNEACLSYVANTLRWYGYSIASDFSMGDYSRVSVSEVSCPPPAGPVPGPDDSGRHDDL
jgi:hypothetical protein